MMNAISNRIGGTTRIKNGKSVLLSQCKITNEWFNTEVTWNSANY